MRKHNVVSGLWKRLARLRRDRSGGMAIEFGFAAPVIVVLTIGLMDIGRMVWIDTTIANAAYEGARYAAIRGADSDSPATSAQVVTYVKGRAAGVVESDISVAVSWSPDNSSGSEFLIQIGYDFDTYLSGFLPIGTIELKTVSKLTVS